jgi:hypothetical protein
MIFAEKTARHYLRADSVINIEVGNDKNKKYAESNGQWKEAGSACRQ